MPLLILDEAVVIEGRYRAILLLSEYDQVVTAKAVTVVEVVLQGSVLALQQKPLLMLEIGHAA